jgi:hypothetical protein
MTTTDIAIESVIAQVAARLMNSRNISATEAMQIFMATKTFELVLNPESYLHLESAPHIEAMFDMEMRGDWESWMRA